MYRWIIKVRDQEKSLVIESHSERAVFYNDYVVMVTEHRNNKDRTQTVKQTTYPWASISSLTKEWIRSAF